MKNKYDFVFIYEVKNRELESIILLKCELERRGYSVRLIETWENEQHLRKPIHAEIVISFALYNDETLKFLYKFVEGCDVFVNMHWEQIFTNGDNFSKNTDSQATGVYGDAKKCIHICWGENTYNRLIKRYGLPKENAIITGDVTLDFLRKEYRSYYLPRNSLLDRYKIDHNKKIYLFISSFSYVSLPESILNSDLYQSQGFDVKQHYQISKQSKAILLEWFKQELNKHSDVVIVYRPHPAEAGSNDILEIESKYDNFKCINELPINQWILISDKIYTWWSSSIAEVYAAQKGCDILRPVCIPFLNELETYQEINSINSFEEFDKEFLENNEFPIRKEIMKKYYLVDDKEPAYVKVCNTLEEVRRTKLPRIENISRFQMKKGQRISYNMKNRIKSILFQNNIIYTSFAKIIKNKRIFNGYTLEEKKREYDYYSEMKRKNSSTDEEITEKEKRIKSVFFSANE